MRDLEGVEVMTALKQKEREGFARRASGGCHRVDDRVIHHHTSNGRQDVTADQSAVFVKAVTAIRPLFKTSAITEGFAFDGLFTLVFVINLTVKPNPNPVMQGDSIVFIGMNHIFKTGVGARAITKLNRMHVGLQSR